MSLSLEAMRLLVSYGMTAEQILAVAEAQGEKARSSGAERQARYRARKAEHEAGPELERDGDVTRDVTRDASPSDDPLSLPSSPQTPQLPTHTRGEKTRVREEGAVERAFNAWNDLAKQIGNPAAKSLTADRRRSIKARIDEAGETGWLEALEGVRQSRHCQGKNDRDWRADIDFVCQPKSFNRLREGFYGRDAKAVVSTAAAAPSADEIAARWDRRVADYRKAWTWNEVDWGPKPGREGCKAPAWILEKHGYAPKTGDAA